MNEELIYEEMGMITDYRHFGNLSTKDEENVKEDERDLPAANMTTTSKQMKCIFLMMAVLAVILLGACAALVAAFAEISNLSKKDPEAIGEIDELKSSLMILNETLQQLYVYSSCADVLQCLPSSPSGYYWIRSHDGSDIHIMYCDMTRSCGGITGGWMRVAELDVTDNTAQCPDNLALNTKSPRTCRINITAPGCSSTAYSANSVEYSKVCGRIRAYQFGTPDAFAANQADNIDHIYVDGVSLTHGWPPRQHIWTFAASFNERSTSPNNKCPCINGGTSSPPAFVGEDYFCDAAVSRGRNSTLYADNPLWDGAGCGSSSTCCSFNNPPWFYKQLPQPTTDDIEMRVCRDQYSNTDDIAIEIVQIFVQ